jgi:hypothetical protein
MPLTLSAKCAKQAALRARSILSRSGSSQRTGSPLPDETEYVFNAGV